MTQERFQDLTPRLCLAVPFGDQRSLDERQGLAQSLRISPLLPGLQTLSMTSLLSLIIANTLQISLARLACQPAAQSRFTRPGSTVLRRFSRRVEIPLPRAPIIAAAVKNAVRKAMADPGSAKELSNCQLAFFQGFVPLDDAPFAFLRVHSERMDMARAGGAGAIQK
jgi:hypothetical protein